MRKQGLTNLPALFLRAVDNRKVTLGIIELSPARAHIDLVACYFDVVSSYPGSAAGPKGGVVRPLKGCEMGLDRRETGLLLGGRIA